MHPAQGFEVDLREGSVVGAYRLQRKLGEGGMGVVFLAVRRSDERTVALKILRKELAGDSLFRQRFQHEVRAAQAVKNPHLVPIHESDEMDGRPFLAFEYLPGGSLEDLIKRQGKLSIGDTVKIAANLASGLDALHKAQVIHRDVKSSNVLLDRDGSAALTDFGLAKGRAYTVLTRPGQVVGTLDYLAPELIRGEPARPQSDIYALGCVAFECLMGAPPFADKGVLEVGMAHLEESPPDPLTGRDDAPPELSQVVLAALAKDPSDRPATAKEYSNLLLVAAGRERK